MYSKIVEQLIEPILLEDIDKIEIRELQKTEQEIEIIILAPNDFFKKIVGKNGNTIESIKSLVNAKANLNDQKIKITINEF